MRTKYAIKNISMSIFSQVVIRRIFRCKWVINKCAFDDGIN